MSEQTCQIVEGNTYSLSPKSAVQARSRCDAHETTNLVLCNIGLAALRAELKACRGDTPEWLCDPCKTIHSTQREGYFFQPCPTCGTAMIPTSYNLREIATLRRQLEEQTQRIAELETRIQRSGGGFAP